MLCTAALAYDSNPGGILVSLVSLVRKFRGTPPRRRWMILIVSLMAAALGSVATACGDAQIAAERPGAATTLVASASTTIWTSRNAQIPR